MRKIGTLFEKSAAERFGDYLLVHEIDNRVDPEDDGSFSIWVHSEDQVDDARQRFARFERNPSDSEFQGVDRAADSIREQRAKSQSRAKTVDVRTTWGTRGISAMGPVTLSLIVISVGVAIVSRLGADTSILRYLHISILNTFRELPEVTSGEVWRLITPIFIHYGVLHLVFNMLWTKELGGMIEYQLGSRKLLIVVGAIGVGSNLTQMYVAGPLFGGMSGVVFGLFGYVWIRSRFDPGSGLMIAQGTVNIMLIWFLFCFSGLLPIANGAHAAGLALGVLWGFVDAGKLRKR